MGLKNCIEFVQNSQKWCTEFASCVRRIFNFLVQNSDNPSINSQKLSVCLGVCLCVNHLAQDNHYTYRLVILHGDLDIPTVNSPTCCAPNSPFVTGSLCDITK